MAYVFLGSGTTNSNGVAKLEKDAEGQSIDHSYTGTGAGEIDVVASLDNPITSGSVQSTPYEVCDCYRYDEGLQAEGHHNDIWTLVGMSLDRGAEYSTLTETATSNQMATIANIPLTDYHVEVDLYLVDGDTSNNAFVILNSDYSSVEWISANRGEWTHISRDYTNLAVNTRIRLIAGGNSTELRFKNFKLYPI